MSTTAEAIEATVRVVATDLGTDTQDGVFDLLWRDHMRRNPTTRFYSSKARNDRNRYRALVDWAMSDARRGKAGIDDWHQITHGQLAHELYGVEPTAEEGKKKSESNKNSLRRLESAGLIEWRVAMNPAGTGRQTLCLEYRLLPVPQLSSVGASSPRSSVG